MQLTPRAQPLVLPAERERFGDIVRRGFSQRRKKLSNLLPTSDARRAEHLSSAEWVELWRSMEGQPPPDPDFYRLTAARGIIGGLGIG